MLEGKPAAFANVDTAADDVALIAFTSGTTGQPKGCMHFHRDVIAMCDAFPRSCLKPARDDVFCGTPPLAFTFGLGGMLCFPLRFGRVDRADRAAHARDAARDDSRVPATVCFTAPTFYRQMAQLARKATTSRSLKKCVSAGEALPDATRQLFKQATGIELIDGLGSTEMIHIFVSHAADRVRRGATGLRDPRLQGDRARRRRQPVPAGRRRPARGEGPDRLQVPRRRSPAVYVQRGWNVTGDAYLMDADGYFFYQARTDDMIISAGYNIAGPEVESALLAHPAVAECGVVGAPDEERGMIVKAYVVLKPGFAGDGAMAKALQDHVKAAIAPYKYPRAVEFRDALPRTETGKLQRFKLRMEAASNAGLRP